MHSLHALYVLGVGPACMPASVPACQPASRAMAFFAGFQGLGRHGAVCYLWFSQLVSRYRWGWGSGPLGETRDGFIHCFPVL